MPAEVYLPKGMHWEKEGIHIFLDPEPPHWIAVDSRGAQIIGWLIEGLTMDGLIPRYAATFGGGTAKAWLHVHDFVHSLLRSGFAMRGPIHPTDYLGRAAYARPTGLKELWFHTNNICNLACTHCLVGSAPWVRDWGLPTRTLLNLVDEAVELGVDRFYMTGGEPFLRKDIFRLIRYITGSKRRELILMTNATLFQGERAASLKALDRQRLRFQVSIDGASPETNDRIRGKGSFDMATQGLHLLAGLGLQISVTTAVTASNLRDLPGITKLAHRLGVRTQHLMWLHRRGRILGQEVEFTSVDELIHMVSQVKQEADRLGISVDNYESIKRRVNGRPGVKYDLGNACWDSLCIYSDGTVYPSAALANIRSLALGVVVPGTLLKKAPGTLCGTLGKIWKESPVAEVFRQASVAKKGLKDDPLRYLTGGGDLEHSFWFNAQGGVSGAASSGGSHGNGDLESAAIPLDRLAEILTGPDPYTPLYRAMMEEAMWELARSKQALVNRKSGYDVPRVIHAMGEGAIHCATDDLAVSGEIDIRTLHSNCVLAFDVDKPRRLVREFYAKAAETPQAELCCPTKFDVETIAHIPKEVLERFYGCGSPVTMANLREGEIFVDLGSGAGIDCFIAAKLVGPTGKVIGVDMTDRMLQIAGEGRPIVARNLGYDAVEFRKGYLEQVPVESKSADLVTSNCVINLSPDKPLVFAEIWRILKDNGRTVIADIVSDRQVPAHLKVNPQLWGECTVGALTEEEFLGKLEEAGFYGLSILKKTYWKTIEGYDFYSVTAQGFKFAKSAGCRFIGQRAVYLGPMKAVIDEEGHLFPRNMAVEVCTDTAAKLSKPPYAGAFAVIDASCPLPLWERVGMRQAVAAGCSPGCC